MTLMLAVMKSEPTLRGACSQDGQGSQAGPIFEGRRKHNRQGSEAWLSLRDACNTVRPTQSDQSGDSSGAPRGQCSQTLGRAHSSGSTVADHSSKASANLNWAFWRLRTHSLRIHSPYP